AGCAADERRIPADSGVIGAKIGDAIDVVAFLRIAQEIVQERPEPGIPRLRIGGEPDDLAHVQFDSIQLSGKYPNRCICWEWALTTRSTCSAVRTFRHCPDLPSRKKRSAFSPFSLKPWRRSCS